MPPKKRKVSHAKAATTASLAAAAAAAWTVTGSELIKAFEHIMYSLPTVHNQWFTAEDWCTVLPLYWSALKNYKDQVTPQKFIQAIKKHFGDISGERNEINPNGVYSTPGPYRTKNKHRSWCFLITERGHKCPLPPTGSSDFCVGNISEVLKLDNKPAAATAATTAATTQQEQSRSQPVATNKISAASILSELRNQNYFDSPEAWRQFMPSNMPYPKGKKGNGPFDGQQQASSPGLQVKNMIEKRMIVCQDGIQAWWKAVEGFDTSGKLVGNTLMRKVTVVAPRGTLGIILSNRTDWTDSDSQQLQQQAQPQAQPQQHQQQYHRGDQPPASDDDDVSGNNKQVANINEADARVIWTQEEQEQFKRGVIINGWGQWKDVAKNVPTKSHTQVSSRGLNISRYRKEEEASMKAEHAKYVASNNRNPHQQQRGGTVVKEVRPESALVTKISPKDRIIAIDGIDVSQMSVREITTIMTKRMKHERTLTLLTPVEFDPNVQISEHKIRSITLKCHLVYTSLRKALENFSENSNSRLTWRQCCEYATTAMKDVGFAGKGLSADLARRSHVEMKENDNKFLYPIPKKKKKKGNRKKAAEDEGGDDDAELEEEQEEMVSDSEESLE